MGVVFPETCTTSADTAIWTVVDLFPCIVVPELADVAVVARRLHATFLTRVSCLLRCSARHAKHVLCCFPVQCMVLNFIMAVPARVPVSTLVALDLDIALVVLAAQDELLFWVILLIILFIVVLDRSICWTGVARAKLIRVLGIDVRRSGERRGDANLGEDGVCRVGREGPVVGHEAARRGRAHVVVSFNHQAMDHLRTLLLRDLQRPDLMDARAQMGEAVVGRQRFRHGGILCGEACAVDGSRRNRRTGDGRVEVEGAEAVFEGAGRVRGHASCVGGDVYRRCRSRVDRAVMARCLISNHMAVRSTGE